ncbi:hypothetical protein SAMN05877753_112141 [Bacillus oleivorans]|uniref:Uncharacterized protein n=1 Tax=Bacillus oleivorans TaxID=1448271 RepID=A0A285D808_9BACI|nr:CBO0543 family protein [Bacillus oleivorans]SNX75496.1 hypothetical protein SAMN05877753_112141 [Bacillus oleivorans]
MKSEEVINQMIKVFTNFHHAHSVLMDNWYEIVFLTPRWWLGLILGTIPWFLWWKFHNKNFTGDLFRAGLFMAVMALLLDSIGVQLGLWVYPYDVFPFIPGYFPWDLTLLPISVMIFLEIKPHWSPIKKSFFYAIVSAFVGEPLAIMLKLYESLQWNSVYSFPVYIVLFLLADRIARSKKFNSSL